MRFLLFIALAFTSGMMGSAVANTPKVKVVEEPPAWLGVGFNIGTPVTITEVIRDAPADIAGIVARDVIVAIDDKPVPTGQDLIDKIKSYRVGDRVRVSVSRRGRLLKLWTDLTGHLTPAELIQRRLVDKKAPALMLPRMHGKNSGDLAQLRGKVVVLEFWSTTCAQCKETFEALANFEAENIGEVAVLIVTPDSQATLAEFLKVYSTPLTVLHDSRGRIKGRYYAEMNDPTVVVIGRDGIVRHADTGPDLNMDDLLLEAKRAARERPSS